MKCAQNVTLLLDRSETRPRSSLQASHSFGGCFAAAPLVGVSSILAASCAWNASADEMTVRGLSSTPTARPPSSGSSLTIDGEAADPRGSGRVALGLATFAAAAGLIISCAAWAGTGCTVPCVLPDRVCAAERAGSALLSAVRCDCGWAEAASCAEGGGSGSGGGSKLGAARAGECRFPPALGGASAVPCLTRVSDSLGEVGGSGRTAWRSAGCSDGDCC